MKIEKLNINGKKETIEVLDKIFSAKIIKDLLITFYIRLTLITKGEAPKQNKRMKLLDLPQKSTHKKEQVMQDTLVEKLKFS